jgi:hypothetical protein
MVRGERDLAHATANTGRTLSSDPDKARRNEGMAKNL